eukprot:COSAG06_NODE_1563_length_9093_cov_9.891495_3_plen_134_part_00
MGYLSPSGRPLSPMGGGGRGTPSPRQQSSQQQPESPSFGGIGRTRSDSVTSHGSGHSGHSRLSDGSGEVSPRKLRSRQEAWKALTEKNWVILMFLFVSRSVLFVVQGTQIDFSTKKGHTNTQESTHRKEGLCS